MPAQAHMVAMLAGDPATTAYYNDYANGFNYARTYNRDGPRMTTQAMKRAMGVPRLSYSQAVSGLNGISGTASRQAASFGYLSADVETVTGRANVKSGVKDRVTAGNVFTPQVPAENQNNTGSGSDTGGSVLPWVLAAFAITRLF